MKPILESIAAITRTTNFLLPLCLDDLTQADACQRIRNGAGPSIAWEVGHMLDFRVKIMGLLGSPKESPYTARFTDAGAKDGKDYPAIADFQRQWDGIALELEAALETATDEALSKKVPGGPHGEQTALAFIQFLTWHEAYHIGAIGTIRKELGYAGPAERVGVRPAA
ncbi:MAG: DinB family protein [Paludibaculum sp.]